MQTCYHWNMIIVIANSKGGVGKSTLAVHLAGWLHTQGHRVTLADCDTQQSSMEWIHEAVPEVKAVRLDNPDMILSELPQLNAETDYVVADGPGSQTETSRALLLRADLAIVPAKASMLEVRALAQATESGSGGESFTPASESSMSSAFPVRQLVWRGSGMEVGHHQDHRGRDGEREFGQE